MFELPAEVIAKPLALIGLTGLDIANPVHRSIWDAFSNNRRPDCAAIQFKLLGLANFLLSSQSSYEWHIPKGTG
ncbi:PREDICTED: trafficking protein particle complex subunit 11-like [Wasmannia auropunctata]|uniref:trafficking protein particle complex subunit 11-like n=1 Tax=Wasmannia auropunctata TaxID=64793 RepID=UPI0005EEB6F0|nr:PREDICTED: trafficking protein particle complex subunit 11-like [Wasmannia auropunctata]XP_011704888.1 PREDICTED: trafficking protein particle complex subunit 11-like [Wasmannia auropunctata]